MNEVSPTTPVAPVPAPARGLAPPENTCWQGTFPLKYQVFTFVHHAGLKIAAVLVTAKMKESMNEIKGQLKMRVGAE